VADRSRREMRNVPISQTAQTEAFPVAYARFEPRPAPPPPVQGTVLLAVFDVLLSAPLVE
jgi:hypothetical protein